MKTEEYIESGILELYVLGALSETERQEVEEAIATHTEIKKELERIEKDTEEFYESVGVQTDPKTKADLLTRIESRSTSSNDSPPWLIAASLAIALLSSFFAINYYQKWMNASDELSLLKSENLMMADQLNQVNDKLSYLDNSMTVLRDDGFKRVVLEGTDDSPSSKAIVYWNSKSKEVYFSIASLTQLNPDQQFQLWAIIDGKPVDAGLVPSSDSSQLSKMSSIDGIPSAFAITIEPKGGSENPSLEEMQVIGFV